MIMNTYMSVTENRCTVNILIWYNLKWNFHANIKMGEHIE